MSNFSRRDFLKTSALSLALLAGGLPFNFGKAFAEDTPAGSEFLLLCDSLEKKPLSKAHGVTVTAPGSVNVLEVASGKISKTATPFFGHSLDQNPKNPAQVVTVEKWGRRGALVDFREGRVLASGAASKGNVFFGHTVFAHGGEVLITPEDTYKRGGGQLTLRDPSTFKFIRTLTSHGTMPHQCVAPGHGDILIVLNQGGITKKDPDNLCWIDVSTGKLLNKIELFHDPFFSHLDLSSDGWIVMGGRMKKKTAPDTRAGLISPEGKVFKLHAPPEIEKHLWDEALSVAFLGKSGLVGITYREANRVVVWNYKTQAFVAALEFPYATGILPSLTEGDDKTTMLVSSYDDRNLQEVSLPSGSTTLTATVINSEFGGIGSHLSRLYA